MVCHVSHRRDAGRLHVHARRSEPIVAGVHFEGDSLPLVGVTVAVAKSMLRDAWNVSYFTDAFVNGIRVEAGHALRADDHLEFCQRFGFKGGTDLDREVAQAEALIRSEPELSKIVDEVLALHMPVAQKILLLTLRVLRWSENRFGPVTADAIGTLDYLLQRLSVSLRERSRLVGRGDATPDEMPEAPRVWVNVADGQLVVDGVRHSLDPVHLAIFDCLLRAGGACLSRKDMRAMSPKLNDEDRLDRVIDKLRRDNKALGRLIKSVGGKGYRIAQDF